MNLRRIPLLTRIWPLPDDLPHAAGMGNLPRVNQWFDESASSTRLSVSVSRRAPRKSGGLSAGQKYKYLYT